MQKLARSRFTFVSVTDDKGHLNGTFLIRVVPVNDPPEMFPMSPLNTSEDTPVACAVGLKLIDPDANDLPSV